jgi:hypothetical protein
MTLVHVFWDDGTATTYRFHDMRPAHAFLDEINAYNDDQLSTGNFFCLADERKAGRSRARNIARQLGAIKVTVREMTSSDPA